MRLKKFFHSLPIIVFLAAIVFSCSSSDDDQSNPTDPEVQSRPNVLFIIADDMGKDATSGYMEGSIKANTPNLDALRNRGLTFNNMWVNPTCSPTRSSILTGKYGFETGIISPGDVISNQHQILHDYIANQSSEDYATALIGKWHLSQDRTFNPESLGMDYYAGLLSGAANSYTDWTFTQNGQSSQETDYITEKFTDLSIDWINHQENPWFLWLAYNAPHTPFHLPPAEMHSQGALPSDETSISNNPLPYYLASIEAMDYQIGRLFSEMSDETLSNTVIIFLGDNGTPGSVIQAPYARGTSKGTLYQGGINVPFFMAGPGVTRLGTDNALINGVDLYATIASLTGAEVENIHQSKSFVELLSQENDQFREYVYSEVLESRTDLQAWCIRNSTHKLLEWEDGSQELYDLSNDPYESNDLLTGTLSSEDTDAKSALEAYLSQIRN